jgi:hypothetical protein
MELRFHTPMERNMNTAQPHDKPQVFTVRDDAGKSTPIPARTWQDALDAYARIDGFYSYPEYRHITGHHLSVFDAHGQARPRNLSDF